MSPYADRLRVLPQFRSDEQDKLQNVLFGRLEHRLARWQPGQVRLELSVKERGSKSQRTVLECWVPGKPKLVATSTREDLDRAVAEVRDDMWHQLDRLHTKEAVRKR
jgi:ribosome-associated translation inhibitor RaiA